MVEKGLEAQGSMALDSSIWKKSFDTVHGEVVMATLTVDGSTRSGNEDG